MYTFELFATPLYALLAVIATEGVVSSLLNRLDYQADAFRTQAIIEFALTFSLYCSISLVLLRFAYLAKLKVLLALLPVNVRKLSCKLLVISERDLALTLSEVENE